MFPLNRYSFEATGGGTKTYAQILKDDYGASVVYPLVDIASGTTITAYNAPTFNGTLTGWDLQNAAGPVPGTLAPYSDGVNDFGNIYSPAFSSVFNGDVFSIFAWVKVPASVWTDSQTRSFLMLYASFDNYIQFFKYVNNALYFTRAATALKQTGTLITPTDWFSLGFSCNTTTDEQKAFVDGVQHGSTLTSLGSFSGTLSSIRTAVGSSTGTTPTVIWDGWMAYLAFKFGSIWTPTDFANMHNAASTAGAD